MTSLALTAAGRVTLTLTTSYAGQLFAVSMRGILVKHAPVGPGTTLVVHEQPSSVVAGAEMSPPPQVRVEDAFGNLVTSPGLSLTLAVTSSTGAVKPYTLHPKPLIFKPQP